MNAESPVAFHRPESVQDAFLRSGLRDPVAAQRNWDLIASSGIPSDLLAVVWKSLHSYLAKVVDRDLALQGFAQFVVASRSPLAVGGLIEREPESLLKLLRLTSTSVTLTEILVGDPESLDLLRLTDGRPVDRDHLVQEVGSDLELLADRSAIREAIHRHANRELLRIAYGDIVGQQPSSTISEQLSFLADAISVGAYASAERLLISRFGRPTRPDGTPARNVLIGFGRFGGREQSYAMLIEVAIVFDADGKTNGERVIPNREYAERLADEFSGLLDDPSRPTEQGAVYSIDSPFRQDVALRRASATVTVSPRDEFLHHLETQGRTWHRQAFLKARTIAGDIRFGDEFLDELQPWIFQRYLTRSDIAELQALKRRIERRSRRSGSDHRNVISGRGGMSDVEFVIQFLQLLNGGDLLEIRKPNTLDAIEQLEANACIHFEEKGILSDGYLFLQRVLQRLQIVLGPQVDSLPADAAELERFATHAGFDDDAASANLRKEYQERTELIRRVLDHVMHDAFGDETETAPEVDLILDPNPTMEQIENTLARYGFSNPKVAHDRLIDLATERIRFLSTRRCRTFLASIAPALLNVIGKTPLPDETLTNLCRVSDSLGGKGVLWELFSYSPPTLDLYVRLCACSPYLSDMLTSNPGMLDDLMDALVQNKLPSIDQLQMRLDELCQGADDVDLILHSFKNSQHLTAGVRDILGKDDVSETMAFLSDVAEVCLRQIATLWFQELTRKYGQPCNEQGIPCDFVILGLGKLGGREPNYHSNVDVVLVYEADGVTQECGPRIDRHKTTSTQNHHFFHELAQKFIQQCNRTGPLGRLFEVEVDQELGGTSGALAITLHDFAKQFEAGRARLSAWQSLCRARPILGAEKMRQRTRMVIDNLLAGQNPPGDLQQQIHDARLKLQQDVSELNLKRAAGGTLDVEFIVQGLQLLHASTEPACLATGTIDGLERLAELDLLDSADAEFLAKSYRFLRGVEARLRLMNTRARHDLPTDSDQMKRLALLLSIDGGDLLRRECLSRMSGIRERFLHYFHSSSHSPEWM